MTYYTTDFDKFHRCPVAGCEWNILYGALRCYLHRGPASAQYLQDSEGAILQTRFFTREEDPDFNPDSYTAA